MKLVLVLLLLICAPNIANSDTFLCYSTWKSDGNYYFVDKCFERCASYNNFQNQTTNFQENLQTCCQPVCQNQVAYHVTKRTVYIAVVGSLIFFVILCCTFGCFGPSIKRRWVIRQQSQNRVVTSAGMTQQVFDQFADDFLKIFTQEQRDNWVISFTVESQHILMNWFTLKMKKLHNFQYKINLKGQDVYGIWVIIGFFVSTDKGIMAWGVKNYYNMQNNSIDFENQSSLVYEVIRQQNGDYEGKWLNRMHQNKVGDCLIKRKQVGQLTQQVLNPNDDPNVDVISVPHSKQEQ